MCLELEGKEERGGSEMIFEPDQKGLIAPQSSVGFFLKVKGEPVNDFKHRADSYLRKMGQQCEEWL